MEPKFQSSFIPKGPIISNVPGASIGRRTRQEKSLFYILASTVFIMSVLSASGVFGYKFYLKYSIDKMGADLEDARMTLQPDIFDKSQYFKTPIFSDLSLNEKGDVNFSFKAMLDPTLVSYERKVEKLGASPIVPTEPTSTSTATSTTN